MVKASKITFKETRFSESQVALCGQWSRQKCMANLIVACCNVSKALKYSRYTVTPNRYNDLLRAGWFGALTPVRASYCLFAPIRTGFWATESLVQ